MKYSENATPQPAAQGQQCPVNPQSSCPDSAITESPCAYTGSPTIAQIAASQAAPRLQERVARHLAILIAETQKAEETE